MKTQKERDNAVELFEKAINDIKESRVNWFALSMKFHSGTTIALHSKNAPKRPKGLS